MNKQDIESIIKNNEFVQDFLDGKEHPLICRVEGVPIAIYKEGIGASYFYKLPWDERIDYSKVTDFMKYAIPIISELVEKRRDEKLTKSDF